MDPDTRSPSPPFPGAMLSNPDLRKLYMSASCPELKAESVISSDEEASQAEADRNEPLEEIFEPLETHDEFEPALSMDPIVNGVSSEEETSQAEVDSFEPLEEILEPLETDDDSKSASSMDQNDHGPMASLQESVSRSITEAPVLVTSALDESVSSISTSSTTSSDLSTRRKLNWQFKGLTLWLELEEFDNDLTRAVEDFSAKHSSPVIPKPHTTAIYGMEHLSVQEAKEKLMQVKEQVGAWPAFARPTGITSDIAQVGRPGQVCSIAWSELTLSTGPDHEEALDKLHALFYGDTYTRDRPWKPHNSIAYDNPEDNTLSLLDTVVYLSENPSLLGNRRRVEAISLWMTEGKMEEWEFIDRVRFW